MKNRLRLLTGAAALCFASITSFIVLSCGEKERGGDAANAGRLSSEGREVLEFWALFALEGYGQFESGAEALAVQVEELCAAPTDATLESARGAYDGARTSWLRLRTFGFGPEEDLPLRLGPKINFQPPRNEDIEQLLDSLDPLPSPDRTGAQLRGFPALEALLYGSRSDGLETDGRECEYLLNVATDLSENATLLRHAWAPEGENFVAELLSPTGERHYFETEHEALSGLVGRMGYAVENLRDREIHDPMGAMAGEEQPDLIVSAVSARTLDDFRDQILGLEELYFGGNFGVGLSPYARSEGVNLDSAFRGAFLAVRDAIEALDPSFEDALLSDRDAVEELDRTLEELQLLYQIDLIGGLNLSQIFNDVDGD